MRQIAAAKGSYGLEQKLTRGQPVSPQQISPYLKNRSWVSCPAGGVYSPGLFTGDKDTGDVQHAPACSVHGSLSVFESSAKQYLKDPAPYFAVSMVSFAIAMLLAVARFATSRRRRLIHETPKS